MILPVTSFFPALNTVRMGGYACFIAHQANLENNDYNSHLWLYNVQTEQHFQLTGLGRERSFSWLENSEEILFAALRSPEDQKKR